MLLAVLVAFLAHQSLLEIKILGDKTIFWMETISVECFGFAWLVKAEVIFKDKKEDEGGRQFTKKLVMC